MIHSLASLELSPHQEATQVQQPVKEPDSQMDSKRVVVSIPLQQKQYTSTTSTKRSAGENAQLVKCKSTVASIIGGQPLLISSSAHQSIREDTTESLLQKQRVKVTKAGSKVRVRLNQQLKLHPSNHSTEIVKATESSNHNTATQLSVRSPQRLG